MKKILFSILIVVIFICLIVGYNKTYTYKLVSHHYIQKYQLTQLYKKSNIKIYEAWRDYGPPNNTESFIVIEKNDYIYKVNPKYYCHLLGDSLILSFGYTNICSVSGNWIYLERKKINGLENISYMYDTIPNKNVIIHNALSEGLYYFENGKYEKIGLLTEFTSIDQMERNGFYFLTPPGVFYSKKIILDDL